MSVVVNDLWWREEDANYIRHRSDRYPGAIDIEVDWTLELRRILAGLFRIRTRRVAVVRSGSSAIRRVPGSRSR
jgi:hypothetical protein